MKRGFWKREPDPPPAPPTFDIGPVPPQPPYERDWEPGDRAECIADNGGAWILIRNGCASNGPKKGDILRVGFAYADHVTLWLAFDGWPGQSYPAGCFRKIRPCEADFREQLRKRKPVPVRALEDLPA